METNYKVTMSEKQYNDYLEYLTTAPNIQDVKKPKKTEFGEDNKDDYKSSSVEREHKHDGVS